MNCCTSMHIGIDCQISCSCPISFMNLINDLAFAQIQLHRQYQITSVILFFNWQLSIYKEKCKTNTYTIHPHRIYLDRFVWNLATYHETLPLISKQSISLLTFTLWGFECICFLLTYMHHYSIFISNMYFKPIYETFENNFLKILIKYGVFNS